MKERLSDAGDSSTLEKNCLHDIRQMYSSAKSKERKMAVSTCVKCNGRSFELALFAPLGESKKLTMVQCSQCGTPIGTLDPAAGA